MTVISLSEEGLCIVRWRAEAYRNREPRWSMSLDAVAEDASRGAVEGIAVQPESAPIFHVSWAEVTGKLKATGSERLVFFVSPA